MEQLEHVIRTIVADDFCSRAIEIYKSHPEMEKSIDKAVREETLENYEKFAHQNRIPSAIQNQSKEQIQKMTAGKHYFSNHCLGIIREWTQGKEMQEGYLKELESLGVLREETIELLKNDKLNSPEYIENTQIIQKIDIVEPKLILYTFDFLECLQRKDSIISTLTKEKREPDDEAIKVAVIKEHPSPEDYIQNFRKGFEAASKYNQLIMNQKHENNLPKLIVNINDFLMNIFEKYFIKADTNWLYKN
jgi:hypothetical protein